MAGDLPPWIKKAGTAAIGLACLLVASCSKNSEIGRPPEAAQILALGEGEGAAALDKKFAMQKGDVSYNKDGTVTGGKRSEFEGKRQVAFGGDWNGKSYGKKQYGTSDWGGSRERDMKKYESNKDGGRFKFASLFGGKESAQATKRSNFDGKNAARKSFGTNAAYEASGSRVAKPSDAKTDWRRSVSPQPRIETLADVQKMNVDQTRRLLGRDD